jgi:hypothetical protein
MLIHTSRILALTSLVVFQLASVPPAVWSSLHLTTGAAENTSKHSMAFRSVLCTEVAIAQSLQ